MTTYDRTAQLRRARNVRRSLVAGAVAASVGLSAACGIAASTSAGSGTAPGTGNGSASTGKHASTGTTTLQQGSTGTSHATSSGS